MKKKYFLIGADLVPTDNNSNLFVNGHIKDLVGDKLEEIISGADFRIFNLEAPLVDNSEPIMKWGPPLKASVSTINGYKALNVNLLTLANNHILDYGKTGLYSTIDLLKRNNIDYVGVGEDLCDALKSYTFKFDNKTIGVYACVENEFSVATDNSPGANPFDPLCSFDYVENLASKCDFVIVLYHGGKEHYRFPSPNLQKICRHFIDKGADLVVCQHSHCIGCEEKWGKGTIVYGQGNFIFDDSNLDEWQTGLLLKVDTDFQLSYYPIRKSGEKVRLAEDDDSSEILSQYRNRSSHILENGYIEKKYQEFALDYLGMYLKACAGRRNLIIRMIDKLTGRRISNSIPNRCYKKSELLALINYIECEAHRELFLAGMKQKVKKLNGE